MRNRNLHPEIQTIDCVDSLNKLAGQPTLNTFACILEHPVFIFPNECEGIFPSFYTVFFNTVEDDGCNCCEKCDFRELSLSFHVPGERIERTEYADCVRVLAFHKELFIGSHLEKTSFRFFLYNEKESLYISQREKSILWNLLEHMQTELHRGIDLHSRQLMTSYIRLFLEYCSRFYQRQFYLRSDLNKVTISRFDFWLNRYIRTMLPAGKHLPSPKKMAEMQGYSLTYFSDMMQMETGETLNGHIQSILIDTARQWLANKEEGVEEIADELGFRDLGRFNRLFKALTGCTP